MFLRTFSTLLGMVFGLALLVALLAGGYFLFKYVVDLFGTLEPQVKTITAIASIVALLSALIIAGGLKARSQKENNLSTTLEKANIYERLIAFRCEQLKRQASGEELVVADSELINLEQRLALHGSPKVITAYVNLRRLAKQEEKLGDEIPELLKKLVLEMRGDLGRTELSLKENDLLDLLRGRD